MFNIKLSNAVGTSADYTTAFKHLRDAKLSGTVVETNRLVIRLEKVCSHN